MIGPTRTSDNEEDAMAAHEFGGDWTTEKLERVRKYLQAYTTIFARNPAAQKLIPIYVDAFAGTGYRSHPLRVGDETPLLAELVEPETEAFLKGSAQIALEVEPPFKRYLFIEKDAAHAKELEKLKAKFPNKAQVIQIERTEANAYLKSWCARTDWCVSRAVMFLDPYGMQVDWPLIEAIARTQAIDLWLLFPLGVAVSRLLTRNEPPPVEWAKALTRIWAPTCGSRPSTGVAASAPSSVKRRCRAEKRTLPISGSFLWID